MLAAEHSEAARALRLRPRLLLLRPRHLVPQSRPGSASRRDYARREFESVTRSSRSNYNSVIVEMVIKLSPASSPTASAKALALDFRYTATASAFVRRRGASRPISRKKSR